MHRALLTLALLAAAVAAPAAAQSTGRVAGTVTDADGNPMPAVNVVVDGTTRGVATNVDGEYSLLLRPGTYTLLYRFVGYATARAEDVSVRIDQTTTFDVTLREESLGGEEVVVTAERPLVETDRTTTKAVVDSEQLDALPAINLQEVVNLQAGVVDGHFRGGRIQEVAYLVNGVPINNAFSGQAAFTVEQNQVENLEVISGVFNAEYGQAQSGVVNIVTKDVPRAWTASYLGYAGTIASGRDLEFTERTEAAGDGLPITAFQTVRVPYGEAAGLVNVVDQQLSFGGPILPGRFGVRVSGRYIQDRGTDIGRRLFLPSDSSSSQNDRGDTFFGIASGDPETWRIDSNGDGAFVPLDGGTRMSLNGNAVYNVTDALKLDYNVFLQGSDYTPYSQPFKYNPDGLASSYGFTQTHIAAIRYLAGTNMFVNLSYSFLRDNTESYLYEDPLDPRYVASNLGGSGLYAFSLGGNNLGRTDRTTATHTVVGSVESQLNSVHLIKTGFQVRAHSLNNREQATLVEPSAEGQTVRLNPSRFADDRLDAQPFEAGVYVQDRIELDALIINAGVRADYFDPNYLIPVEWALADSLYFRDPASPADSVFNRTDAPASFQVSPRLGIAFPISATGVLRFSAGMFFQTPRFSLLYTNPEYEPGLFGNAALDPERTMAFEMGIQQGITNSLGIEVTAYSKDIRNLTGTQVELDPRGNFVSRWINVDIGTVRGVTLSLFQRASRTSPINWTVDYTYQFAEGTASDPGESFIRGASGEREEVRLVRLNWDRRHSLNGTLGYRQGPLRASLLGRLQSGTPYTSVREFINSVVKNDQDQPASFTVDARVFYRVPFVPKAEAFLQVDNLTDAVVQRRVYPDTGLATESVQAELYRGSLIRGINSIDEYVYQPSFFGSPRRVSLGLRVSL
ncbi:TonB-dependent receptor [Rubrivirga sp.]|uniref:TonB-dependent receptor n=1 Tax=Rubrivirga sp. TaxID=1885344 RepID=UPI003B525ADC